MPIENLLDFLDLPSLFEHYGLSVEKLFSTPEGVDEVTRIVRTLYNKAENEKIPFPQYIFSTRSGDHLRLDIDIHSIIGQRYYLLFRDLSKEELIATVNLFGLQMSDLTSMYAYDGETSLEDLQGFAQKAVDKVLSGKLPIYSKIQRGKYWNSISPYEVELLEALDMDIKQ